MKIAHLASRVAVGGVATALAAAGLVGVTAVGLGRTSGVDVQLQGARQTSVR